MKKIKKGDIVARISYNKDIIFIVENSKNKKNIILIGLFERIIADCDIDDLELVDENEVKLRRNVREKNIGNYENRLDNKIITGKILHLDGDKRYSEKSLKYYQKIGINAVVKNIPENKQPNVVYNLLKNYSPDILVITRT